MRRATIDGPEGHMTRYSGGCHCGAIRFEVEGELRDLDVCNCSICRMTAYVHWSVPPERFRLLTPESAFETYRFGTGVAEHRFCRTCGISPFRRSRSEPEMLDVNARCLEGVDAEALPVGRFDGVHWEQTMRERQGVS
jgi:hypothetical protein